MGCVEFNPSFPLMLKNASCPYHIGFSISPKTQPACAILDIRYITLSTKGPRSNTLMMPGKHKHFVCEYYALNLQIWSLVTGLNRDLKGYWGYGQLAWANKCWQVVVGWNWRIFGIWYDKLLILPMLASDFE